MPFLVIVPLFIAVLLNQRIRAGGRLPRHLLRPLRAGRRRHRRHLAVPARPAERRGQQPARPDRLTQNIPWTVDVPWAWISLAGITVWWVAGFNMVILLAGLKGINAELYEAAAIDGAGAMRKFWSVTLPGLRPVMAFVTTTTILGSANMFGQSYLLTKGAPGTRPARRSCTSRTRACRRTRWAPRPR